MSLDFQSLIVAHTLLRRPAVMAAGTWEPLVPDSMVEAGIWPTNG